MGIENRMDEAVRSLAALGFALAEAAAAKGIDVGALTDDEWRPSEEELEEGRELVRQVFLEG